MPSLSTLERFAKATGRRVRVSLGPRQCGRLDGPFDAGEGGPGGWIILDEPELHLGDAVLVPDLAGWRSERLPHVPEELTAFELAPDWVCEVLSPSTSTLDRVRKMPVYAREEVQVAWLIEELSAQEAVSSTGLRSLLEG